MFSLFFNLSKAKGVAGGWASNSKMVLVVGEGDVAMERLLDASDVLFAVRREGLWLLGRRTGSSSSKRVRVAGEPEDKDALEGQQCWYIGAGVQSIPAKFVLLDRKLSQVWLSTATSGLLYSWFCPIISGVVTPSSESFVDCSVDSVTKSYFAIVSVATGKA